MTTPPPPIYSDDPVEVTRQYLQVYSDWRPASVAGTAHDFGDGLVRLFGHLAQLVVDRLNQMPEKNFRTFLDLIGIVQEPSEPARAPVTFTLSPGTAIGALVPAGTRLSAAGDGSALYETEEDLFATAADIVIAYTRDPLTDRWASHDPGGALSPFEGTKTDQHRLYIASLSFTLDAAKTVAVRLAMDDVVWAFALRWEGFSLGAWVELEARVDGGTVTLPNVPAVESSLIAGVTAPWIRATLATSLPREDLSFPSVDAPTLAREGVTFDILLSGSEGDAAVLDPSVPFAPLPEVQQGAFIAFSSEEAFSKPGAAVLLRISAISPPPGRTDMTLRWEYSTNAGVWQIIAVGVSADGGGSGATTTQALLIDGTISLVCPADWSLAQLEGRTGRWLRATVVAQQYTAPQPPMLEALTLDYSWDLPVLGGDATGTAAFAVATQLGRAGLRPDQAFANQTSVDLNRDFYPFGEAPTFNDTFYISCEEAFSPPARLITVRITVTNATNPTGTPAPAQPSSDLALAWECWDAQAGGWIALAVEDHAVPQDPSTQFSADEVVSFAIPETIGPIDVNGAVAHWVRARIVRGDYGLPARYVPATGNLGYVLQPATLAPPSLKSLTIDYSSSVPMFSPPDHVVVENDFHFIDHSVDAEAADVGVLPFLPMADSRPTLYLAFNQPLPDQETMMYIGVTTGPQESRVMAEGSSGNPPAVAWEYWNGESAQWTNLDPVDETHAITRAGLVKFIAPPAHAASSDFGIDPSVPLWWLRVRWESGSYCGAVGLDRIVTRTVFAANATTTENEILGSSTGQPAQLMSLAKTPVLSGEIVQVRESDRSSQAEIDVLAAEVGLGPLEEVTDPTTGQTATWVQWIGVANFNDSEPRSRHYVLDRGTGGITFGDGQRGMIPPAGRSNVRAASYRSGGGQAGNRPNGSITELKSAVPYVQGVTNLEPADGGTDPEDIAAVRSRGPKVLRHGERAVTASDFEDLALEASTAVARVLAVPAPAREQTSTEVAEGQPGEVGIVVVERTADPRPAPTLQLLNEVSDYVSARMIPTFDLWVAGPGFIEVSVDVEVVSTSLPEAAQTQSAVVSALLEFLHPLTGGFDGDGWAFGRRPHRSDVLRRILSVPVVDHVRALTIREQPVDEAPSPGATLIYSGIHTVTVSGGD
jgi:hypothetical protein